MSGRAVVIAGGEIRDPERIREQILPDDFIIAADAGARNAAKLGVAPALIVGDFDSAPEAESAAAETVLLPAEKDHTDTHEAVLSALARGYREILILGALGGRFDHALANTHLLLLGAQEGAKIRILNEQNEMFAIRKTARVRRREGYYLSLLPFGEARGITLRGVKYPLTGAEMLPGNPYGVSNEWTKEEAEIEVEEGILLAILSRDAESCAGTAER